MTPPRPATLFLCTGNSARSQMAEAIFRERAGEHFASRSAGVKPAERVHPLALRALAEIGVDASGLEPKHAEAFMDDPGIAHVVTVCDSAAGECPATWPSGAEREHWSLEDPAAIEGSEELRLDKFREIRDELVRRIDDWLERHRG